jgi:DNA polymerase-1
MSKLAIIDGNAIIHRAYHAIPPLTTKDGVQVNAVYGFISMLLKVLNDLKPEYIAVTFDVAGGTFRHEQFAKYKATRVKADQALYDQIPLVHQVVEAFNFPIFEKKGYEADDVIGTIAKRLSTLDFGLETFIVTGDMDTLQLVNDKVKVYTLRKGLNDIVIYDPKGVVERYGFKPEQMVDYKAIRGDVSDNIPGVPGIGEKGATELIQKLGTLENIYQNIKKLKELGIKDGVIKKLAAGEESAMMSKKLATIDCAVPDLDFTVEKCHIKPFDREKIVSLFQKLEFISLLKRIPEFKDVAGDDANKKNKKPARAKQPDFSFVEIGNESELAGLVKKIEEKKQYAARCITEGNDLFKSKMNGLVVVVGGTAYFVTNKFVGKILQIFSDKNCELIGHDLKQLLKVFTVLLKTNVQNKLFDVMIASYILSPGSRAHDIPSLVLKFLGKELTASSGQESLFGVDKRTAAYEVFLVASLVEELKKELIKIDNLGLFEKIEMPLVAVLAEMELQGVAVDKELLSKLSVKAQKQMTELTKKIYDLAGEEFNIASPLQLREILFEKLNISTQGIKKGKTGLSTGADELDKLQGLHPIIEFISAFRELAKLQNTYIDVLPTLVNSTTGRIHSSFNQAVAATGRLSSSDPNLQNIPIRTELGHEVRNAFIAEPGYVLISADYSQIELRIVASLAEDAKMIEIFNKDEDIHRATAAAIQGVPLDQVTKEMRYAAKEVNFGVLYGMGVHGLSWRAEIPHAEAKEFIDKYFQEFSGVKKFIDNTIAFTKKEGFCETLFGRRRYLPELSSSNYQLRSAAERMAVNHPVQGTAADLIKMAMIEVHQLIQTKYKKDDVKLILQVHDELVLEVKEAMADEVSAELKKIMENVVKLRVPVKVEVGAGKCWGEIK